MTTAQADAINQKYKDMETELNALKATIKVQQDTIVKQKVIIKTQIDTILKQDIVIKTQIDTITKYNEKVVYIETDKDSIDTQYSSLQDSLWKWALGPTLIYTMYPDSDAVYLMDLSHYYLTSDDFGILMVRMSNKEYIKYQTFVTEFGLPKEAFWRFRTDMKLKRVPDSKLLERKVWKYKKQWK